MNGYERALPERRLHQTKELSEKELAFAKSGLKEMNRLVEEAVRMDERLE